MPVLVKVSSQVGDASCAAVPFVVYGAYCLADRVMDLTTRPGVEQMPLPTVTLELGSKTGYYD